MENLICSRRHPLQFFLSIIFSGITFCLLGLFLIYVYLTPKEGDTEPLGIEFLSLGILFLVYGLYSIRKYFKNSPRVKIQKEKVIIGRKNINLDQIEKVQLVGKKPFPFLGSHQMESMELILKDGKKITLFDKLYLNLHEIKSFLHQVIILKEEYVKIEFPTAKGTLAFQNFSFFKGSLVSLRCIISWIIPILFILTISANKLEWPLLLIFSSFGLLLFFLLSLQLNYFGVNQSYLVIRNHNFIWHKKNYPIDSIEIVVFENEIPNAPHSLRVITKNFESSLFQAATLRHQDWTKLQNKLRSLDVKVSNELKF